MKPGDVYRVAREPAGSAFRVLAVRGDEVDCWGGRADRMAYRTFRAQRFGPKPLPRSSWPVLLLPPEERPEVERKRSNARTARKLRVVA